MALHACTAGIFALQFLQLRHAMLNIHHLELFYYVAKYEGVSAAARNMPYGIQQPAISGQILELEDRLGGPLFQRRPFALTHAGEELYHFIKPFFEGLDGIEEKVRGGATQVVRLAASTIILRDHLPEMLQRLRPKFPKLKVLLREGVQPQIEAWLAGHEVDLAVTVFDGTPPAGVQTEALLELPVVLIVPKAMKIKCVEELLKRDRIDQTLISPPASETITKNFQDFLAKRGVVWPPGMEVNSLELVKTYAACGFGLGLTVAIPGMPLDKHMRALPLEGVKPITIAVLRHPNLPPVALALIEEVRQRAKLLVS
ncbi:MAG: LysR family transcriptional regulator [Verrucomicrobia bacterium]|nr:LysR family transcriptional regulator [Verrucomicrobiota bacterium]NBU08875.1 LysR family transcriptional regulator [Pseudomonadota bacterium]NDA68673.1 LysR family transcriptional regulator [Verrucomicrobiota bacterium]NDD40422.1 LysR family transcriptional regulator [Verrucomicrobiota bacterium]NDF00596.1 LysR family transcriptional regulator [Verrucomicrobiota bacterium]